jgi:hypothetical protein
MIDVHRSWVQRVENAATNVATALNRLLGPALPQTSSTLLTALASSRNVSFRTKQPSSEGVDDRFDQLDITRPTIELATQGASVAQRRQDLRTISATSLGCSATLTVGAGGGALGVSLSTLSFELFLLARERGDLCGPPLG